MSGLTAALAELVVGRAKTVLVLAVAGLAVAAIAASGVDEVLSTGGNEVPGSDSVEAAALLDARGAGAPNLLVLVSEQPELGPRAASLATAIEDELDTAGDVDVLATAWSSDSEAATGPLRSDDGTAGLVVAHIAGDGATVQTRAAEIAADLRSRSVPDGLDLEVGGSGPARADLIETTDDDLIRAELLALPITLLLLLWVFRTPVAAALPLITAAVAVVGALATLRVLAEVVEISVFARSIATAIGLAMAVDMSLFLVGRYREHRPTSESPAAAIGDAVRNAGPAILFSGLTTGASLAALVAFSIPMLRSFAYAGIAVVGFALLGGLIVLPSAIVVLGDRVDRWPIRSPSRRRSGRPRPGRWHAVAVGVMARPVTVGLVTLTVLLVVASPIRRIDFGLNDDRVLPPTVESRAVLDIVRNDFGGLEGGAISVVFLDGPPAVAERSSIDRYAAELSTIDGVVRVEDRDHWLAVIPEIEPISEEGRELVELIRSVPSPTPTIVGGEAARLVDNTSHVAGRLPLVVGLMIAASAVLLAVLFRSVLLTVKAIALNLLSLSAMFGAIVWIFQDGRFAGVLGYTPTGLTDVTVPMLMFGIAFGLAMDYEVFLLSRIREEYRIDGDTVAATARGLQRTGGILSASAVLMAVVFLSFATGSVTHLKVLGVGISLAVIVDAFVVRTLLVPSFMAIGGAANWWPGKRADKSTTIRRAAGTTDRRREPTPERVLR